MSQVVHLRPSGRVLQVNDGETVLDAAIREGVTLPYGCRNGRCGACRAQLLRGEIQEGPERSSPIPGVDSSLLCRAYPMSEVELQVHELETPGDIAVKELPCKVARMQPLSADVMGLWLKLPAAERLQFLAGQYIDILLSDGRHRSFSLANAPHHDEYLELHVRHHGGGAFSDFVFSGMREKTLLRIRGPLGAFFLREDSTRPLIFVAGGTGFAPIKGIIEHCLHEGMVRPIRLYWGARTRRGLYLDDLARTWAREHAHLDYIPVLSEAQAVDAWEGRTGLVHEAVGQDVADVSGYDVYAGGPPPMVRAIHDSLLDHGLQSDRFYADAFEVAPR